MVFAALLLFASVITVTAQTTADPKKAGEWSSPLRICWSVDFRTDTSSRFASDNENIFLPLSTGSIISVLQKNGAVNWEADFGGNLNTRLLLQNGRLFSAASFSGGNPEDGRVLTRIREINRDTGVPFWSREGTREIPAERVFENFVLGRDSVLLANRFGSIQAIELDGNPKWKVDLNTGIVTQISVAGPYFAFGTSNNTVVLMAEDDGQIVSQMNVGEMATAVYAGSDSQIYVGYKQGSVVAFDVDNSLRNWKTKTGAGISEIKMFEGNPVVISKDNYVYYISAENGKKLWKRKLAGRIFGYEQIDDRHAVFVTSGASTAVILDLTNGKLVDKIDVGDDFTGSPVKTAHGFAVPTRKALFLISNEECK